MIKLPCHQKTTIMELLTYCLSLASLIVLQGVTFLPFAISCEPIQITLQNSSLLSKLVSSVLYFVIMYWLAATVLSNLLFIMMFLEGILRFSPIVLFCESLPSLIANFKTCFKSIRTMKVLLTMENNTKAVFLPTLGFVGEFFGIVWSVYNL